MAKKKGLLLDKSMPVPAWEARKQLDKMQHPDPQRAERIWNQYISGFGPEEIAPVFEISPKEVEADILHVQSTLPTRVILSALNDRNRILILREQSATHQQRLREALEISAREYLAAGQNPSAILAEYRKTVGMEEKPGGINVQVTHQNLTVNAGVSSGEDILRRALAKNAERKSLADPSVIDVEPERDEVQE